LVSLSSFALDPAEDLSQYTCRQWNRQNGFPGNGVNAVTQTTDGFLWIATQKGLVRYDGVEFKVLPLPENRQFRHQAISSLSSSADGGLWFGIQNGAFGSYRPDRGFLALTNGAWVEPAMNVHALFEASDASLWVGSVNVTGRHKPDGSAESFPDTLGCISISEDSHKRVWLGTMEPHLYCWQSNKMTLITNMVSSNEMVCSVVEDAAGQLWFGTQSGLRCFDAAMQPVTLPQDVGSVLKLLVDSHGVLWVATDGQGLFRCKNGQFSSLKKIDGLADDRVTSLFEDREGNLWVGTRGGLSVLSDVMFPVFSQDEGLQKGAYLGVAASAQGGLWAAGVAGISRFDVNGAVNYSTEAGLSSTWMKLVFEASDGDLYMVNANREIEIFRGGKVVARQTYKNQWPTALAEDSNGVVASFAGNLIRVSRAGVTPYPFGTNAPPPFLWIRNLATAKDGSLLVATVNGFFRIRDGKSERLGLENGLPGSEVLCVSEDDQGVIWAGLSEGLARIKGREVRSWRQEDGLFDNFIRTVISDDQGRLWVHSSQGIFSVRKESLDRAGGNTTRKVDCVAYDGMDAVKTIETPDIEYSACKTSDGRIWFPSPQGLILVDPNRTFANPASPRAHIERVRIDGKEYISHTTTVPAGKGEFEVQYTAPTFIAPEKVQFCYRLDGYDSNWVLAGNRRTAFYTNLKPGRYKFTVQSLTAEGTAEDTGDGIEFELLPHFYQSGSFDALCGLSTLAVLFGIYACRVRHLRRKHEALQIARDQLEAEVQARTAELTEQTLSLEKEVEERERMQSEVERVHREMMDISRLAGMAEVATSVLHNVGNVLNSVNVSANLLTEHVKKSKVGFVGRVATLLAEHDADLESFLDGDPKGQKLPSYLADLSKHLADEQAEMLDELAQLNENVGHINNIVAMQQSYATVSGVTTCEKVVALVEEALRINETTLAKHRVILLREFEDTLPDITVDRHKALQVLVNLIQNADHACESCPDEKKVTVRANKTNGCVRIAVSDNGIGIPPENMTRIFNHAFTTRKDGHGFGLHFGALAAREMGGELRAHSDGAGKGATFTLDIPLQAPVHDQARRAVAGSVLVGSKNSCSLPAIEFQQPPRSDITVEAPKPEQQGRVQRCPPLLLPANSHKTNA